MSDDKKIISLYLDDLRIPPNTKEWIIVRSYNEAIKWMKNNGCPDFISFDHDLGMVMRGKSIITEDFIERFGDKGKEEIIRMEDRGQIFGNQAKRILGDEYLKFSKRIPVDWSD